MNKKEIEKIIDQRDPYLMIDEVKIENSSKGTGIKKLTGDEFYFEGHFPGFPVMPGVLILECIAQTAMVVAGKADLKLKYIKKIKFRHTIIPGDEMRINVELRKTPENLIEVKGEVVVNEKSAASGTLTLE